MSIEEHGDDNSAEDAHPQAPNEAPASENGATPEQGSDAPSASGAADEKPRRTEKQQEASRRNGALSRGPVTAAGRARSRLNAMKHGIRSQRVMATASVHDELIYYAFRDELEREYEPRGFMEQEVVGRIAENRLLLLRAAVARECLLQPPMEEMVLTTAQRDERRREAGKRDMATVAAWILDHADSDPPPPMPARCIVLGRNAVLRAVDFTLEEDDPDTEEGHAQLLEWKREHPKAAAERHQRIEDIQRYGLDDEGVVFRYVRDPHTLPEELKPTWYWLLRRAQEVSYAPPQSASSGLVLLQQMEPLLRIGHYQTKLWNDIRRDVEYLQEQRERREALADTPDIIDGEFRVEGRGKQVRP